jgi:hypothetical protein
VKDAYYFPHDSNARNDPKMLSLKLKYKAIGVGMYWIFIEILRDQENFKYQIDNDITWESLSVEFMCSPDEAREFIEDCIHKFKLFKTDSSYIWSDSLIGRMNPMLKKRDNQSAGGKKAMEKRWGNKSNNDNLLITNLYDAAKLVISSDNKVKESKVKESKEDIKDIASNDASSTEVDPTDRIPYQNIVDLYHLICVSYPKLKAIGDNRKKAISARWKQYKKDISVFEALFRNAEESEFLKGRNKKSWQADFNWILNDANMSKVLEGKYGNKNSPLDMVDGKELEFQQKLERSTARLKAQGVKFDDDT